jgi:hypothetical protein
MLIVIDARGIPYSINQDEAAAIYKEDATMLTTKSKIIYKINTELLEDNRKLQEEIKKRMLGLRSWKPYLTPNTVWELVKVQETYTYTEIMKALKQCKI